MYLCSERHEEICFESKRCPLCEALKEKAELEEGKNDEIDDLANEINDLQAQIAELKDTQ